MRAGLLLLVSLLAAPVARAEADAPSPAMPHPRVVSAERLFGFAYASRSIDGTRSMTPLEETGTTFGPLDAGATTALFAVPRLAFDVFVYKRLSVGTALSYARTSSRQTATAFPEVSLQPTTNDTLVVAPRIGFLAPLRSSISLWVRAGFTYVLAHRTRAAMEFGTNELRETLALHALTLEAPLAIRVVDHFLLTAGPTLDLGLDGATSRQAEAEPFLPNRRVKEIDLGLMCGFGGDF